MSLHQVYDAVVAHGDMGTLLVYMAYSVPLVMFLYSLFSPASLRHIPTEGGPSFPLLSYKAARAYLRDATGILQRGYDKHKGKPFKVAMPDRWVVVLTGKKLVDELQRLPDDAVSFIKGASDLSGTEHMFGRQVIDDPFHVPIIRTHLTKNLAPMFSDVFDEVSIAFQELIPACDGEWVPVHAIKVARSVVARTSNRIFAGLPICRHPEYLNLVINFTVDVAKGRYALLLFPPALKGIAAKILTNIDGRINEGLKYLGPLIEQRMALAEKFGDDSSEKPDDMLQWIIDEVRARNQSVFEVVRTVLLVNFAAIHTSSSSFTHALYHLAANPEFIASLREEIETIVSEEGWSKAAIGKMWKLDSFMRESQRYNGINSVSVKRKALKPLTLSDGTFIPKGTVLVTPTVATHFDDDNYKNPTVFDPFRYYREKERDMSAVKHQFVTTSPDYVSFGHGKHACPGRFFAANELKAMMAYVVVNYDVKFEKEGVRPENIYAAMGISPDPNARVLFRKRESIVSV
uniref:Cytochrome P450 n=1 Tax=Phanerodontia chrysosporium TaxID=2822231 RepID=Q587P3_PHACH|nr:cytochrome P450 [Phanerodontia chrysosporium]BAL05132.1 cytochrome P450 [Phanerodontia chrysosporium]